jgi:hypothetical protein
MKNILVVILITLAFSTQACEFCGCGVGNFYLGIMPQFHRNFVGVRYQVQDFNSHVGLHPSLATSEHFQSTELWARFYPTSKLQVLTLVAYHFNEQTTTSRKIYLDGLGDIPVLVNYNLINTQAEDPERTLNHNLWLGGGIKLPTGKYKFQDTPDEVANPNFQLGTGSVDVILNGLYALRYKKLGVNADVTYKVNTYNKDNYRFGNKLSGTLSVTFVQQIKKVGLMPNAGMYYENSALNRSGDINISDTGGTALFATGGLEIYWKKYSIGFNYRNPVSQNLANGRINANERMMMHFTFLF